MDVYNFKKKERKKEVQELEQEKEYLTAENEELTAQIAEFRADIQILKDEKAQGDAGQGRVGQGVANHGVALQYDENTDAGAEDGDADGNEKGILHEIITEHGRPPF